MNYFIKSVSGKEGVQTDRLSLAPRLSRGQRFFKIYFDMQTGLTFAGAVKHLNDKAHL